MDPFLLVTIIFIALMILGFFVWFTVYKSKEKERLVLLEKGFNPAEIPDRNKSFSWLKMGCVVTGIVVGLIIGVYFENLMEAAPVIGMLLFGWAGLIVAHYVDKSNDKS